MDAYLAEFAGERDGVWRRLVVRNGHAKPRQVTTAAGAVEVSTPRVNDKRTDPATGERRWFSSAILPPWCRKTAKIAGVLPLLYLHGLSSGDFVPALEQFLGTSATTPTLTQPVFAGDVVAPVRDRLLYVRAAEEAMMVLHLDRLAPGTPLPPGHRQPPHLLPLLTSGFHAYPVPTMEHIWSTF